jgi:hypothetical protein
MIQGCTVKNAGISGIPSLGTETDIKQLFTIFYSSVETVLFTTILEVVKCETLHNERRFWPFLPEAL